MTNERRTTNLPANAIIEIARFAMPGQYEVSLDYNPRGAMGACFRVTYGHAIANWATLATAYAEYESSCAHAMECAGWVIEAGEEVTA